MPPDGHGLKLGASIASPGRLKCNDVRIISIICHADAMQCSVECTVTYMPSGGPAGNFGASMVLIEAVMLN